MNIILETTTGLLKPAGVALQLPRGATATTLQFVTNDVAALLPEGQPVALKLYQLTDPATVIATFNAWTRNTGFALYQATIDALADATLGWLQDALLLGRISYGTPNVDSAQFHVRFGGTPLAAPQVPQIVVTQPSGPVNYVQPIGHFGGRVALNQVEGYWRVKAACSLLGLQLSCQDAPTGANMLVDVVKGGVAQGKVAQLTAASKSEETIFGAALALDVGDIVQFKPTQVGSGKAGSNLDVKGIVQLV